MFDRLRGDEQAGADFPIRQTQNQKLGDVGFSVGEGAGGCGAVVDAGSRRPDPACRLQQCRGGRGVVDPQRSLAGEARAVPWQTEPLEYCGSRFGFVRIGVALQNMKPRPTCSS